MSEHITDTPSAVLTTSPVATGGEQLRLLDAQESPFRFRLDMETRRRGLAHVAELRRQLAEQRSRWAA